MSRSKRILIRKLGVVLAPAILFLLFLYLVLPFARKYYVKFQLELVAVEKENVIVYAPDRDQANRVHETFQHFRSQFLREFDGLLSSPEKRLRIHIFETKQDLSRYYERKRNQPLHQNSGFYDSSDESIAIVKAEEDVLQRAVRHEAVHYLMHSGSFSSSPEWSPWLSEGIASVYELYESDTTERTNEEWKLSRKGLRYIVRPYGEGKPLKQSIDSFLHIDHKNFRSSDNRDYYRQSRLLVCFLMHEYPEAFQKYVRYEMKEGPTGAQVFFRIFGPPKRIQKELISWVKETHKKMEGEIK